MTATARVGTGLSEFYRDYYKVSYRVPQMGPIEKRIIENLSAGALTLQLLVPT